MSGTGCAAPLGLFLGTAAVFGVYQFAQWLAVTWNPFA